MVESIAEVTKYLTTEATTSRMCEICVQQNIALLARTVSVLDVKDPEVFPLVMTLPSTRSSVHTFPRFHSLSPAASPAASLQNITRP